MEITSIIVGVLLLIVLSACLIVSYTLNKRTPAPDGTDSDGLGCAGCKITSCRNHPNATKD